MHLCSSVTWQKKARVNRSNPETTVDPELENDMQSVQQSSVMGCVCVCVCVCSPIGRQD